MFACHFQCEGITYQFVGCAAYLIIGIHAVTCCVVFSFTVFLVGVIQFTSGFVVTSYRQSTSVCRNHNWGLTAGIRYVLIIDGYSRNGIRIRHFQAA